MARYEYIAKDTLGVQTASTLHAESAAAVADILHRDGFVVLSIREVGENARSKLAGGAPSIHSRVPSSSVTLFTKQLASMLHAGLPMIRGLYALAREEQNRTFSRVLFSAAADVEGGEALSSALAKYPRTFPGLYIGMIRSGEQSGTLDTIMRHLVVYMSRTEAIKRKVKSALMYPVFVVGFSVLACLVLLIRIVPMMAQIYEKLGADLPAPTKAVIGASDLVSSNFWLLLVLAALCVVGHRILTGLPGGKVVIDTAKLRVPIFGALLRKVVIAKFLRTLGILVVSGLPVLESLELAGDSAGNAVVSRAAKRIAELVSQGSKLSTGFHGAGVFPEIVVQMVSTGEETGTLGEMLSSVSDHYDEQVESTIEGLSSIIEPLMIVFIGGIIALILVAMFLPVFHLGAAVRQGI